MRSGNTMLLVFNRGGPGRNRSRERRGVISQKETQFHSKAQQIPRSLNQHFQNNQPSSLENTHTQDKTSPTRLLRRRSIMSSRRNTLLSCICGCDDCPSRTIYTCVRSAAAVCCCALADQKSKLSYVTKSGLLGTLH